MNHGRTYLLGLILLFIIALAIRGAWLIGLADAHSDTELWHLTPDSSRYVAIADLSLQDGATAGLDDEHEDIMSHVVAFDTLLEMIETGAANTGPLVLSALWLARHRDTLRNAD